MKLRIILVLVFLIWLFSMCNCLSAGENTQPPALKSNGEGPQFYLDYSNLKGEKGQTLVEFYLDVGFNGLAFNKQNSQFQAKFDLDFTIYDDEYYLVKNYSLRDTFSVTSFAETQSLDKARIVPVRFQLPPRKYQLAVIVTDLETGKSSQIFCPFEPRDFNSESMQISDVQLSQKFVFSGDDLPPQKSAWELEPNVQRIFAQEHDLCIYYEIYHLTPLHTDRDSSYTVALIFRNDLGREVARLQRKKLKLSDHCANFFKIPVSSFEAGAYALTVRISDRATGKTAEAATTFRVFGERLSAGNSLRSSD